MKRRDFFKKSILAGTITASAPFLLADDTKLSSIPVKPSEIKGIQVIAKLTVKPVSNDGWINNISFDGDIIFFTHCNEGHPPIELWDAKVIACINISEDNIKNELTAKENMQIYLDMGVLLWNSKKVYQTEIILQCKTLNTSMVKQLVGAVAINGNKSIFVTTVQILDVDNSTPIHFIKTKGINL